MMEWWWLSFAAPDEFLGVCIVQGRNVIDATVRAHKLGINPGGSVLGAPLLPHVVPAPQNCNRLLSRSDALELKAIIESWV